MNNLGEYILNARKEKGYSMGKLAELSGVDKSEISRIEDGSRNPKLITIKKICKYLDISYRQCLYIKQFHNNYIANNPFLLNYYKNYANKDLKQSYKNIVARINECEKLILYLEEQLELTDNKVILMNTIEIYEQENNINNVIREILEEKILNEYLNS